MNFLEAVAEMRKGKKVKRRTWDSNSYREINPDSGTIVSQYNSETLFLDDVEATDWEVVDEDENWNWYENGSSSSDSREHESILKSVKKCRDLILDDMFALYGIEDNFAYSRCIDIVKQRFGDLK